MSGPRTDPARPRLDPGYTLVEMAVVLILAAVVLSSIGAALADQRRFYASQAQIVDTRDATRIALEVLSGELRSISPAQGDLYAIADDSLALRSVQGMGVVCARSGDRLRIWQVSGVFGDAWRDSALVYLENGPETASDDEWRPLGITGVSGSGSEECLGEPRPQLEITLDRDPGVLPVGTPVRAFRPFVYRLYRSSDRAWWLGRRLRGGQIQPVAGPFEPPESGGLRLEYLTAAGTPAATPDAVVQIRIGLKARSAAPLSLPRGAGHHTDALISLVHLRNAR